MAGKSRVVVNARTRLTSEIPSSSGNASQKLKNYPECDLPQGQRYAATVFAAYMKDPVMGGGAGSGGAGGSAAGGSSGASQAGSPAAAGSSACA